MSDRSRSTIEGPMTPLPATLSVTEVLARRLGEVALLFQQSLVNDLPAVTRLTQHVERYRGKMLRPTLVITSGMAVRDGSPQSASVDHRLNALAAVVEMIHMSTLVHDDVLDEADLRRGGATVNTLRGNETAVMLGDFLISSSFHLCSSVGEPWLNTALGAMTTQLCAGEILQLSHRGNVSLDDQTYFEIIRRKTGVLAGACCGFAARLAGGSPETSEALRLYGEELGMAFQIQDDVLDLIGDEQVVGKTLGIDLRKGKLTLPVVIHLARCDGTQRSQTIEAIEQGDVGGLVACVRSTDALNAARERAMQFVSQAKSRLSRVTESPSRHMLESIADAAIERTS
ncbi:MAG: polyprenyl synthetase family protein [Phycisphaerales bacterium]|nr:polyprenyl synthetase family protein [Phycisphaerales bacterium]